MKMTLFVIALMLAGCVTAEQAAEQNAAACTASGHKTGTEEFDWCMIKREQAQKEDTAVNAQVMGAALQSYASNRAASLPAPSATYTRPVNCTSNRVGTYTYTNCY